jgi:hypothetical protein
LNLEKFDAQRTLKSGSLSFVKITECDALKEFIEAVAASAPDPKKADNANDFFH